MSYVQHKLGSTLFANPLTFSLDAPPSAGNFIVIGVFPSNSRSVTSITDTAGNTYQAAGTPESGNEIWYAYNVATANPLTFTVNFSGSTGVPVAIAHEYSGVHTAADPLDVEAAITDTTGAAPYNLSVGPVTPAESGALCFLIISNTFGQDGDPAEIVAHGASGYWATWSGHLSSAADYTATVSWDATGTTSTLKMALFRAPYTNWVNIPDYEVVDVDFGQYVGGQARVTCELWSTVSSVALQARLLHIPSSISLGSSAAVYGTTPTEVDFSVTSSGVKSCLLQIAKPTDSDVWCAPGAKVGA